MGAVEHEPGERNASELVAGHGQHLGGPQGPKLRDSKDIAERDPLRSLLHATSRARSDVLL